MQALTDECCRTQAELERASHSAAAAAVQVEQLQQQLAAMQEHGQSVSADKQLLLDQLSAAKAELAAVQAQLQDQTAATHRYASSKGVSSAKGVAGSILHLPAFACLD